MNMNDLHLEKIDDGQLRFILKTLKRRDFLAHMLLDVWDMVKSVLGLRVFSGANQPFQVFLNSKNVASECVVAIARRDYRSGLGAVRLLDRDESGAFYMVDDEIAARWHFGIVRVEPKAPDDDQLEQVRES